MAGLWETWMDQGEPLETFTIITTSSNELVRLVHERMPVIFTPDAGEAWLEKGETDCLRAVENDCLVKACEKRPAAADNQGELNF